MNGESSGALVTFEGGEGSGKSTVCTQVFRLVGEAGYDCWKGGEPGATPLGAEWRRQMLNPASPLAPRAELFLFLADRAQNFAENVVPRLARGEVVFLDRHRDSTAAYQGGGRGYDAGFIAQANDFATTLAPAVAYRDGSDAGRGNAGTYVRLPDLTILLDISPEDGLRRSRRTEFGEGVADRFESEDIAFHARLREAFLEIARSEPDRVVVLDASAPLADIIASAYGLVTRTLARKGVLPKAPKT
jgi:dTMP kinase